MARHPRPDGGSWGQLAKPAPRLGSGSAPKRRCSEQTSYILERLEDGAAHAFKACIDSSSLYLSTLDGATTSRLGLIAGDFKYVVEVAKEGLQKESLVSLGALGYAGE